MIHHVKGLALTSDKKYGVRYTVCNGAGLTTVKDTSGVKVDDSPPLVRIEEQEGSH